MPPTQGFQQPEQVVVNAEGSVGIQTGSNNSSTENASKAVFYIGGLLAFVITAAVVTFFMIQRKPVSSQGVMVTGGQSSSTPTTAEQAETSSLPFTDLDEPGNGAAYISSNGYRFKVPFGWRVSYIISAALSAEEDAFSIAEFSTYEKASASPKEKERFYARVEKNLLAWKPETSRVVALTKIKKEDEDRFYKDKKRRSVDYDAIESLEKNQYVTFTTSEASLLMSEPEVKNEKENSLFIYFSGDSKSRYTKFFDSKSVSVVIPVQKEVTLINGNPVKTVRLDSLNGAMDDKELEVLFKSIAIEKIGIKTSARRGGKFSVFDQSVSAQVNKIFDTIVMQVKEYRKNPANKDLLFEDNFFIMNKLDYLIFSSGMPLGYLVATTPNNWVVKLGGLADNDYVLCLSSMDTTESPLGTFFVVDTYTAKKDCEDKPLK